MKTKIQFKISSLLLIAAMLVSFQFAAFATDEITQIQQAIQAKGAKWTAGENWVTKLSPEERRRLCGAILEHPDPSEVTLLTLPKIDNLPSKLDWRDNNGNWVTPVTNQGNCGSCWDFSAVAQVETWWKIYNANLDSMPDLSEQFVLSCSEGGCDGWSISGALEFIRINGVPSESCFPYQADDTIPCTDACADWQDETMTFPGWGYITLDEAIVDNIKNAVYRHPVSASFEVYEDFYSYSGGVYEHVFGDYEGGHAILIVGWNDEEQSWICKNSWAANWGINGYFRIKWGNCGIGVGIPFIWNEVIGEPSLNIPDNTINVSLTVGDSVVEYVTVNNIGSKVLEYSCIDYEVDQFHSDSFNSFDDVSWWCGDPDIGGYNDHWLKYLETPAIDLSSTSAPKLSFMVNWSMEDPAGTDPPWDGWDGCNVWVSTDSGNTFNVAEPITPLYTCQSLWSFGHPEQGWNFGEGIAGWAGLSGGWQSAEFDLTSFIADKVIIRFALASDLAYCSIDDASLQGYFVDEIKVADGTTTLFENHGEDNGDMVRYTFGDGSLAHWMSLSNGAGMIQPNESKEMGVVINTRELTPGNYEGKIIILSNDTTQASAKISLFMNLVAPQHDVAIKDVWLPGESIPILLPIEPGAQILNKGLNDEANFDVICEVSKNGQISYSDTAHVESLLSGESKIVKFDPLILQEAGELEFAITLENLLDDYNDYNNSINSTSTVSNLVDGFETETGFWLMEGGWAITAMGKHSGNYAVHVNGGTVPYPNNMDALMTFLPGFDLSQIEKATLKFWTLT